MGEHIVLGREGRLGTITLDRPAAINALDRDMVETIHGALIGWADDSSISAVLFEGRGPRGFCAGGDVRRVRELVLNGERGEAEAFFAAEYRMNAAIAGFPKPTVALVHGAVMGGGIGIAGHCRHRFAFAGARFAMPEGAIGFFGDVGVNALLAAVPLHRSLLFLLSGLPVAVADAIALNLCDAAIPPGREDEVRAQVLAAAPGGHSGLAALAQKLAASPPESPFCALADALAPALPVDSAEALVEAVAAQALLNSAFGPLATALRSRSPTSLVAIRMSQLAARDGRSLARVLAADLELACLLVGLPDFAEGVRAVLVDKTHDARWDPIRFVDVRDDLIAAALARPGMLAPSYT